jgi:hypothetical protein
MRKAVKISKKSTKEGGRAKSKQFNKDMGAKINALRFSKAIKANTNDIDADFAALAENDYFR